MAHPEWFPVLQAPPGCPLSIAWLVIAPHEKQALRNHSQDLARLASRGGLDPAELCAVLEDRPWRSMKNDVAVARLLELAHAEVK